jgi:dynein heavy chain
LEKQVIKKGRNNQYIMIQEQQYSYNDNFNMFLFCRLPNPHFSPELSAKTTIIDFTVT